MNIYKNVLRSILTKSIIMFAAMILSGCGAGIGDTSDKLSNDYTYRTDGSMRYILPNNIFNEGIYPNVIDYTFDDENILVVQTPSSDLIHEFLSQDIRSRFSSITYALDSGQVDSSDYQFFLDAYNSDSVFYKNLEGVLTPNNTEKDLSLTKEIAKNIIDTSLYYQSMIKNDTNYWIINHPLNKKMGPMSREEFLLMTKDLDIPELLINEIVE